MPFFGLNLASLVWGGFSLADSSLARFYSFHYLLPFVLLALVLVHMFLLHLVHSTSPLFLKSEGVKFNSFFLLKDLLGFFRILLFFVLLAFLFSFFFLEKEIFEVSNPLVSPEHIVPEWYFLPFYAILRAVPRKIGGAVLIVLVFISGFLLFLHFPSSNTFLRSLVN